MSSNTYNPNATGMVESTTGGTGEEALLRADLRRMRRALRDAEMIIVTRDERITILTDKANSLKDRLHIAWGEKVKLHEQIEELEKALKRVHGVGKKSRIRLRKTQ